jgi:hypothetical protein
MPGAPTPPTILAAFGFSAGASFITTPIPYASQQPNPRASYTDGFPPQTVGSTATDPPDVRDFNGIHYATTANIAAFSAGQFFQFNSAISTQNSGYALGAIVVSADYTGLWINETSGNTNNPDTSAAGSGWMPLARYGLTAIVGLTNANVTLTAPQAAKEIITLAGTLTGNVQIIFPPWEDEWLIANNTTGAHSVTCKTASGSGIVVPQGVTTIIYGDGTNIDLVGSSLSANTGAVANTLALRDSSAGLTAVSFNVSSDARLKSDVQQIGDALAKVMALRGVSFTFNGSKKRSLGLIAQEVRDVLPEIVSKDEQTEYLSVAYANVVGVLVEAVKELAQRIARLETR